MMNAILMVIGCMYLVTVLYLFDRMCEKLEKSGARWGLRGPPDWECYLIVFLISLTFPVALPIIYFHFKKMKRK